MKNSFTSSFYSQYLCFLDEFARRISFQLYITIFPRSKKYILPSFEIDVNIMLNCFSLFSLLVLVELFLKVRDTLMNN